MLRLCVCPFVFPAMFSLHKRAVFPPPFFQPRGSDPFFGSAQRQTDSKDGTDALFLPFPAIQLCPICLHGRSTRHFLIEKPPIVGTLKGFYGIYCAISN